jgi:hypothetical protein
MAFPSGSTNVIFTALVVVVVVAFLLRLRDEDEFADLTAPKTHRDVAIMMTFLMFYSQMCV